MKGTASVAIPIEESEPKSVSVDRQTSGTVKTSAPPQSLIIAAFAAVYLIWGSTFLGTRFAIESLPPLLMTGTRYLLAGGLLYMAMRRYDTAQPTPAEWKNAAIVGFCLFVCGNGILTISQQYIDSGLAALLSATVPLLMTLFAWWARLTPRPAAMVWLALVIGFSGLYLLVGTASGHNGHATSHWGPGVAGALLSAVIWSIGSLYATRMKFGVSAITMAGMQMFCGGILLLVCAVLHGELAGFHIANATGHSVGAFFYLVFGSISGFTAYAWLLRVCEPAMVGTYAFVNPVVAVFLGWLLAGEKVSAQMGWGAALIATAVALILVFQAPQTRGSIPPPEPEQG